VKIKKQQKIPQRKGIDSMWWWRGRRHELNKTSEENNTEGLPFIFCFFCSFVKFNDALLCFRA